VALLPEKAMKAGIVCGVGTSHNLPVIVQAGSKDPEELPVSAKVAQVSGLAVSAREQREAE